MDILLKIFVGFIAYFVGVAIGIVLVTLKVFLRFILPVALVLWILQYAGVLDVVAIYESWITK